MQFKEEDCVIVDGWMGAENIRGKVLFDCEDGEGTCLVLFESCERGIWVPTEFIAEESVALRARLAERDREVECLKDEAVKLRRLAEEASGAWVWDEDNDLESMGEDMVVLITAGQLRVLLRATRVMETKPKVIVLCGSSRFVDLMSVAAWLLERDEGAITMGLHLLPWWYSDEIKDHIAEHEGVADKLDNLHLRKIDLAVYARDMLGCEAEIFVVNAKDYIGESTTREIEYSKSKELPVRYYMNDPIGDAVDDLLCAGIEREKHERAE